MFMVTYILNGVKNSKCIICRKIETAYESIDKDAIVIECEKLY